MSHGQGEGGALETGCDGEVLGGGSERGAVIDALNSSSSVNMPGHPSRQCRAPKELFGDCHSSS